MTELDQGAAEFSRQNRQMMTDENMEKREASCQKKIGLDEGRWDRINYYCPEAMTKESDKMTLRQQLPEG